MLDMELQELTFALLGFEFVLVPTLLSPHSSCRNRKARPSAIDYEQVAFFGLSEPHD